MKVQISEFSAGMFNWNVPLNLNFPLPTPINPEVTIQNGTGNGKEYKNYNFCAFVIH